MGHGGDDKAVFDGYAVIEGVCLEEWGVFWIHEILLLISEWLAENWAIRGNYQVNRPSEKVSDGLFIL